jgi:hypothetical protein
MVAADASLRWQLCGAIAAGVLAALFGLLAYIQLVALSAQLTAAAAASGSPASVPAPTPSVLEPALDAMLELRKRHT